MKRKIAGLAALTVFVLGCITGCYYSYNDNMYESNTMTPYYGDYYSDYYDGGVMIPDYGDYEDYYDDYYDYYDGGMYYGDRDTESDSESAVMYLLVAFLGYILPAAMIVVSLIAYLKSVSRYRTAWFIMTAIGLLTAVLTTVFMLLSV